jgi:SAM-dependent methyltransferase
MTTDADLPEHVRRNREAWDRFAAEYVGPGERSWAERPGQERWGIFGIPESELQLLPGDLEGRDTIELGCGTGYVSAWLARRGARPVGIDNSAAQLATARRLQGEHGIDFPLVHGNAERVPYPDASFDLAISEYGAALWADPYRWIPEAARLLRPGGRLIFLTNSILTYLCVPDLESDGPATERLRRPYFDVHRVEWPDSTAGEVEFHLNHGDWVRLLTRAGLDIVDLVEIRVPADATTTYEWMDAAWASRWPCEEVWIARKR